MYVTSAVSDRLAQAASDIQPEFTAAVQTYQGAEERKAQIRIARKNRIDIPRHLPRLRQAPVKVHSEELVKRESEAVSTSRASKPRELYLRLKPEYTAPLCWTNDPTDLSIETYFNPDKINIGESFNIKGLRPVLREEDDPYNLILVDDQQRWYLWDEYDGSLLWVKAEELKALTEVEEQADFVLCGQPCLETEVVYMDFHPAEHLDDE